MDGADTHADELGEFLKARRAELRPGDVGLPQHGAQRRVPGLRREEVAQLAAISTDYYTRLEQARITASAPVLASLARVLRLDDDERAYLHELAGKTLPRPPGAARRRVRPQLQRLLDRLTDVPAFVATRTMDILAWNRLAAALVTDFGRIPQRQRNFVRLAFTDAAIRRLYDDWDGFARMLVAYVRMETADNPDDAQLASLVNDLSAREPHFRELWAQHHVAVKRFGTRTFHHPLVGDLTLDWETLTVVADPDQQLIYWTAEPGTPSEDALRGLSSLAATATDALPPDETRD